MKRRYSNKSGRKLSYTEFGLIGVLLSIAAMFIFTDIGHQVIDTYWGISEGDSEKISREL